MALPSRLLALPRELRDMVYHFYLYDADGYHFNFETCQLRRSGGQPIDLSLMLTCKDIASEMHGLALKTNTLVFSPVNLESERLKAGRYHWQMIALDFVKGRLLDTLLYDHMRHHLTPDIEAKMIAKYPRFNEMFPLPALPAADAIRDGWFWSLEDDPDSKFRNFQDDLIESLPASFFEDSERAFRANPAFQGTIEIHCPFKMVSEFFSSPLRFRKPQVWHIPSDEEVIEMDKIFSLYETASESNKYTAEYFSWIEMKWNYSAAAAAIHFLQNTPEASRLHLRSLILLENEPAVAFPECHAIGLIPFCKENTRLRIERHVSLWKNLFPSSTLDRDHFTCSLGSLWSHYDSENSFDGTIISSHLTPWLQEIAELSEYGMPSGSFSLILDDEDSLNGLNTQVWEVLKQDVAWTYAWREKERQGMKKVELPWLSFEPFGPKLLLEIEKIFEGSSFVRCGFPIGEMTYDPYEVLKENEMLSDYEDWSDAWEKKQQQTLFPTRAYLPLNWRDRRVDPSKPLTPDEELNSDRKWDEWQQRHARCGNGMFDYSIYPGWRAG